MSKRFESVMRKHMGRSKKSIIADKSKKAKQTFDVTNKQGVELWLKNPNRYDIGGIDTPWSEWRKWQKTIRQQMRTSDVDNYMPHKKI